MKKAKIMLSAIAVLALVGGTLAFKAAKVGSVQIFTCDNTPTPTVCNQITIAHATLTNNGSVLHTYSQASTSIDGTQTGCTNQGCTSSITVYNAD
jgi:hypothetical protein